MVHSDSVKLVDEVVDILDAYVHAHPRQVGKAMGCISSQEDIPLGELLSNLPCHMPFVGSLDLEVVNLVCELHLNALENQLFGSVTVY